MSSASTPNRMPAFRRLSGILTPTRRSFRRLFSRSIASPLRPTFSRLSFPLASRYRIHQTFEPGSRSHTPRIAFASSFRIWTHQPHEVSLIVSLAVLKRRWNLSKLLILWWARRDSNPQPRDYESPALTVELQALIFVTLLFCFYCIAYSRSTLSAGCSGGVSYGFSTVFLWLLAS